MPGVHHPALQACDSGVKRVNSIVIDSRGVCRLHQELAALMARTRAERTDISMSSVCRLLDHDTEGPDASSPQEAGWTHHELPDCN